MSRPFSGMFVLMCQNYKEMNCKEKLSWKGKRDRSNVTGWQMWVHGIRYIVGAKEWIEMCHYERHRGKVTERGKERWQRGQICKCSFGESLGILSSTVNTQSAGNIAGNIYSFLSQFARVWLLWSVLSSDVGLRNVHKSLKMQTSGVCMLVWVRVCMCVCFAWAHVILLLDGLKSSDDISHALPGWHFHCVRWVSILVLPYVTFTCTSIKPLTLTHNDVQLHLGKCHKKAQNN